MKHGTAYAARLKKTYARFRQGTSSPGIPEPDDPLRRLAIAILGARYGDVEAERAIDRLLSTMVDWNEVRVSRPSEVNAAMGNANAERLQYCRRLKSTLQSIFDRENRFSLDRLMQMGRREARQYLEALDGVDEYTVASVALWSLGGHGIPVDDRLLEALRDARLAHPDATRGEVQAFLERHISAADAKEFCIRMRSFEAAPRGRGRKAKTGTGRKKKRKKKKVKSP